MGEIKLRGLEKTYGEGTSSIHVLKGITLDIPFNQFVTLMGPSGSGKSTLLHILAGIDRPDRGDVELFGHSLASMDESSLTIYRRNVIGIIFQFFNLLPYLSALENVSLPLYLAGKGKKESHKKAVEALESVGLIDRINHRPSELSGGEQQRVAIARSISNSPSLILADEPTGNLDSANAKIVLELLMKLQQEKKITVFMVTHDTIIGSMGTLRIKMKDGNLESWET
ncbi:MAG: ABC transporter ATP-binding protein [Spirochaetia bacterium]|nr:ABC transporter ATP-binding protein [Spirochaetia bacterium]